ncbi:MAG: hypothetical protein ACK5D5_08885 [Bacteroidota bacterium]|jgi:hypothetical protein
MSSSLKFNYFFSGVFLLSIFLLSCGSEVEKKPRVFVGYPEWMDTTLRSSEKIIRSVEPGMSIEEVTSTEPLKSVEGDSICQYFELKADTSHSVTFSYRFDKRKLSEIEMTIFTDNVESANETFTHLLKYYESKYSKPIIEKGIHVFSANTSTGSLAKISLEDRSELHKGVIHILVYYEE